jgi:hypothetical protein
MLGPALRIGALVLVTAALFGLARFVAAQCGVGGRWLETGGEYTAKDLTAWVEADAARAARYAVPVLVPVDLLFLVFLGATLAVTSVTLASAVGGLGGVTWLFVVLPALYVAVDVAEDALLVGFLTRPDTIRADLVTAVRALTWIKIWSVKLTIGQTALLALAAAIWRR